ncbi:helix-turn-helix transcriptional regulator [Sphingomonas sp. QA11]|uniref:winged helix-turn-helix transcriptional regulator n=1 Tax=Sphingomonas sp. QA11 TaxID=2950605 RepID=UPI00234B97F5|nr:helix-turn-helix domain-containing protein [Sphingomonas sp. QA11]WCM25461.1 helix-turn-helix transcriptional regulator [Sphingomonas sp. QA11]
MTSAAGIGYASAMKPKSFSDMRCSIARTLELVGSWWALLIIRDAMMGARRFKHFEKSLGISKNTLTSRLNDLIDAGILDRVAGSDGSAFDEYVLTEQGRELAPVMIALSQWGDKWVPHAKGSSTEIIDVRSGKPLSQIWPRALDGEKLPLRQISMRRADDAPPLKWD